MGQDLDLVDIGRVHREGALDADTVALLADREGLADTATGPPDDNALEHLDTLLVAFDDLDMDVDGVPGPKVGMSSRSDAWSTKSSVCSSVTLLAFAAAAVLPGVDTRDGRQPMVRAL